jgi:hypothetical protein
MNLESDYIDKLASCYFSQNHNYGHWGDQKLLSVKLLAEIFNQYMDYAQKSKNFTEITNLEGEADFTLALANNLLFILFIMKTNNVSYKDMLSKYIKHNEPRKVQPEWPETNQENPIQ